MTASRVLRLLPLTALLALPGVFLLASDSSALEAIHIALAGPTSGPSAQDGLSAVRAAEMVFERANREGGIGGRPIVLDVYDDQNDREKARANAPQIVAQRQTVAVIGHNFSTCSIAAGEVYAAGGLPAISTASTNIAVTRNNDWYFRVIYNDALQGRFIVLYTKEVLGASSIGIVHETDAYGSYLGSVMNEAAPGIGLEVDGVWSFEPGAPDLSRRLEFIAKSIARPDGPPAVLLAVQPSAAVTLVKRLRELDYPGEIVASDTIASQAFVDGFRDLPNERSRRGFYSDGIYVSTPFLFDTAGRRASEFVEQYVARYGESPDWYAAFAADAATVLVEVMRRAELSPSEETIDEDRRALRDALAQLDVSDPVEGVTGTTFFDSVGDVEKPVPMGRFKSGELVSAFTQLRMLPGLARIEDLAASLDPERVVVSDGSFFYRTDVARVGVRSIRFGDVDFKAGTFDLEFDLWFRHRGGRDVENIVFVNAIEPVVLAEPVDTWSRDGLRYSHYRLHGTFSTDSQPSRYDSHTLALSFHHHERTRDDLIYAIDSLGMNLGRSATPAERLRHARKKFPPASRWDPSGFILFESEADEHGFGHPSFLDSRGSVRRFSQLTMGLVLTSNSQNWLGGLPESFRKALVGFSLIASVALLFWIRSPFPRLRWTLQVVFALIILSGAERLIGNAMLDSSGRENLDSLTRLFEILWWVVPAILVNAAVNRFIWAPAAEASEHAVPSVLRYFVSFLIFLFAFFGVLAFAYDYKLTGLLATSGVLAMIIGLAVQLNITNIFAGVALNLERPFRVGDWIMIHGRTPNPENGVIGQVTDINWRTTRLKTAEETEIVVPNGVISEKTITNFMSPGEMSRFDIFFTIAHTEPPDRIIPILKQAVTAVLGAENDGPLAEPPPSVRVNRTTELGIEYMIRYRLIPRLVSLAKARHTINESVIRHLGAEGIELAHPRTEVISPKS